MKKLLGMVALLLIGGTAAAQEQKSNEEKTLYVVDGRISSKAEVDGLSPDAIANMNVMKGIENAIIITTKQATSELATIQSKPLQGQMITFDKKNPEESDVHHFMLVEDGNREIQMNAITIDKNRAVEISSISDDSGRKTIRIMKQNEGNNTVTVDHKTDVLVVVANADGTFRTGSTVILKEISPDVIRSMSVLKNEQAQELLREHNLDLEVPTDGLIWIELGQPFKAKIKK